MHPPLSEEIADTVILIATFAAEHTASGDTQTSGGRHRPSVQIVERWWRPTCMQNFEGALGLRAKQVLRIHLTQENFVFGRRHATPGFALTPSAGSELMTATATIRSGRAGAVPVALEQAYADAKYAFQFWRPATAISLADQGDNVSTLADRNWQPIIALPCHPENETGHSTFSGAAEVVLAHFFGDAKTILSNEQTVPASSLGSPDGWAGVNNIDVPNTPPTIRTTAERADGGTFC